MNAIEHSILQQNLFHREVAESAMDFTTQGGSINRGVPPIRFRTFTHNRGSGSLPSQDQYNICELNINNSNNNLTYKKTSEVVKIIPEFNGRNI